MRSPTLRNYLECTADNGCLSQFLILIISSLLLFDFPANANKPIFTELLWSCY